VGEGEGVAERRGGGGGSASAGRWLLTSSRERACRKRLMMVLLDVKGRWRPHKRPTLETVSLTRMINIQVR
jgi:hypothetical protein